MSGRLRTLRMRLPEWVVMTAVALVAFALGHQLVYLATYGAGAGRALAASGHDAQWAMTLASTAAIAILLAAAAARELIRLSRRVSELGAVVPAATESMSLFARDATRLAVATFVLALGIFVAVENGEQLALGLPTPGLGLLASARYELALPILGLASLLVAFVAALYRWRRDLLVRSIELARQRWSRHARDRALLLFDELPGVKVIDRAPPGRAPPAAAIN